MKRMKRNLVNNYSSYNSIRYEADYYTLPNLMSSNKFRDLIYRNFIMWLFEI
mgnify:FL=1